MNEANANRTVIDLGRSIAHACIRDRPEQELTFPFSLLTLENYSANRPTPRLTVRDQFKVVDFSQRGSVYWYEMNSEEVVDAAEGVDALPELQRAFGYAETVDLYPTRAWIGVHEAMFCDTEALTSFIATRLVPRLFTAENHALLSGPYGLLNMPGIANVERVSGDPGICALEPCNTVEQKGATGGGVFIALRDNALMLQLAAICFGLAFYAVYGLIPASISKAATPENATSIFAIANVFLGFGTTFANFTGGYLQNSVGSFQAIYFAVAGVAALAICLTLILPAER
ncbi:MAG: MFS transporter [Mesorhizobium sp.]|uniref:family 3 encapsulin nanocompartment shell protein n=1 Tax=Mesorhizobium sp. TaxID=1871066 RepID=UPI0012179CDB|nr:family 3 encapsulin nanocompartment shell protein [Mesorhizobium sp.]TIL84244.1 MAG: MFS transporter [Mesorhizobium sp.]TIR27926.1 MAG: MFS transporter [Mesorhizobium sp.]